MPDTTDIPANGAATGAVRYALQFEGVAIAALAITAFAQTGASWWLFGLLILAPDLAMLGYLAGKRSGAILYNLAHSYVGPVLIVLDYFLSGAAWTLPLAYIWIAHIGIDRAIGYGLKYASGFKATHLGHG